VTLLLAPILAALLGSPQGDPQATPDVPAPFDAPLPAGPVELPPASKELVRKRLVRVVEKLRPNVVQLSIEQRVSEDVSVFVEASGLVLDPYGHVVTIGSALEEAARVSVHFANVPALRPRRARVVGIDATTDVGVLDVGAVELTAPALALAPPAKLEPGRLLAEQRFVVTMCGVPDGNDGRIALGWLHDPLPNPTFGQRRFDQLLRVSIARAPQCGGSVLAQQDGQVVGLVLPSAQAATVANQSDPGVLALPVDVLRRGVQAVLARERIPGAGAVLVQAREPRPWVGFGGVDLDEPEFLRQLGVAQAIVVSEVFEGSPALTAGLVPHDLIVAWNGEPIGGVDGLHARLSKCTPGQQVTLDCVRGLERRKVPLTLGSW
jgi:serine protease Do